MCSRPSLKVQGCHLYCVQEQLREFPFDGAVMNIFEINGEMPQRRAHHPDLSQIITPNGMVNIQGLTSNRSVSITSVTTKFSGELLEKTKPNLFAFP